MEIVSALLSNEIQKKGLKVSISASMLETRQDFELGRIVKSFLTVFKMNFIGR